MGVLPLQFREGEELRSAFDLDGTETFTASPSSDELKPRQAVEVTASQRERRRSPLHHDLSHRYAGRSRLLPQRRNSAHRAAATSRDLMDRTCPTSTSPPTASPSRRSFAIRTCRRFTKKRFGMSPGTTISATGALIAYSGEKTGRSPKDKRVVRNSESEGNVWWGPVNFPLPEHTFMVNRERAIDYLNSRSRLYCVDGFAGWDPDSRARVRVICARPYHALFMRNMLIRPSAEELADFGEPGLRDLQRGHVSSEPVYVRNDLQDERRSESRAARGRHPRDRVCRRDEEGRSSPI